MDMKLFICLLLASVSAFAGDLEEMYKSEVRKVTSSEFTSKFGKFKWGGVNKRVAVSKSSSLFDYKVLEAIAYFNTEEKLLRLDSWVYNRGDQGVISQEKFEKMYEDLLSKLTEYFKTKPKKSGISGATRSTAYTFKVSGSEEVSLLVGFEKRPFRPDFIALVMRNHGRNDRVRGSSEAKKMVEKSSNGDVIVTKIPMIDQGPKGYCVPATLARIGQHYGVDISMHEIAMIAHSSSGGGTSPTLAMQSLKKKYSRVKLKIKDISVKFPGVYKRSGNSLRAISQSEAKALSQKIEDDDRNLKKFRSEVKKQIDKGLIIAWSMVVGLLPENGKRVPQSGGGHMRMIMGYNTEKDEIIFSDSWGKGHEVKRISAKSAFIVSSGLYEIIP